jgi:hypothetical protein
MWNPVENEELKQDFDIIRQKTNANVLPEEVQNAPNAFQTFVVKNDDQPFEQCDKSQFDSRASDYFLMLNNKNQSVMRKRRTIRMSYSEDVLQYEQMFAEMEKKRIEKEYELM